MEPSFCPCQVVWDLSPWSATWGCPSWPPASLPSTLQPSPQGRKLWDFCNSAQNIPRTCPASGSEVLSSRLVLTLDSTAGAIVMEVYSQASLGGL